MVFSKASPTGEKSSEPTTIPYRARAMKRLHNFPLPSLKWGNQRNIRCSKVKSHGATAFQAGDAVKAKPVSASQVGKAIKTKPTSTSQAGDDVKTKPASKASDSIKAKPSSASGCAVKRRRELKIEKEKQVDDRMEEVKKKPLIHLLTKKWNLKKAQKSKAQSQTDVVIAQVQKSLRNRDKVKEVTPKFSPYLDYDEIREDLLMMTGKKPSQRPKKRPKVVQKQIDGLFPGFFLPEEVSVNMYEGTGQR